jgi:hypothetical protein
MKSNDLIIDSKTASENNATSSKNNTILTTNQVPFSETTSDNNINDFTQYQDIYSNLLTNIGSRQSEYLQDIFKLQEDVLNYYDQFIQNQFKLFYPYLPRKKSPNSWYMNIMLEILRRSTATYLNYIYIGYGFALIRTKGYGRLVERATARTVGEPRIEKISE